MMMADEKQEKPNEVVSANEDVDSIYKEKYDDLLNNSVPKAEYDKIKNALRAEVENRVENRQINENEPEDEPNWEQIKHDSLFKLANNKCKTNREVAQCMCDARDAVQKLEGVDIFLQQSDLVKEYDKKKKEYVTSVVKHAPTAEEVEWADRVYTGLRELLDESEDPDTYNYTYSRDVRKVDGLK